MPNAETAVAPLGLMALIQGLETTAYGPDQIGRFDTYVVDLSSWHLSLTDQNPCIWIKAKDLQEPPDVLLSSLLGAIRQRRWQNSAVLVFVDGDAAALQAQAAAPLPKFIFFSAAEQAAMDKAIAPHTVALEMLRQKLTRPQLAPFETNKPVTGSQFFGRSADIERVLQHPHASYLFVGIRRIGKTSLLKEIQRRLDRADPPQPEQVRRVYIDCTVISSETELMQTLFFPLQQTGYTVASERMRDPDPAQTQLFDHYTKLHGRPITFLLDEFDRVLAHVTDDWPLLRAMRTAVHEQKIRIIAAGYRRAMQAANDTRSPFYNLLTPVRMGPLDIESVRQLVLNPFSQLNIHVEDEAHFLARIQRETAGLPNYIQYYCRLLLNHLEETGSDRLTLADLDLIHENDAFRTFVLTTFMSNTELVERALVYALVAAPSAAERAEGETAVFDVPYLQSLLRARRLVMTHEQVDRACRNLEMAGVLRREKAAYSFAVPLFQDILRQTRDVNFLFERVREALQTEKILS